MSEPSAGDFPKLDANYFHREFVRSGQRCPLSDGAASDARAGLDRLLKTIYDARDGTGRRLGPLSSFYALLLADGDRLGKLAGELGGDAVGKALAAFTREAPEIVREHSGVTFYVGGDDALAMLPAPEALSCAASLADSYRSAFQERSGATLSAAVAFAHVRLPLGAALVEAHRLLDDITKEANGRDSLAVGVLKPGGLNCQWVTTWTRKRPDESPAGRWRLEIEGKTEAEVLDQVRIHLEKITSGESRRTSGIRRRRVRSAAGLGGALARRHEARPANQRRRQETEGARAPTR